MKFLVLKFGGTSVGTAQQIKDLVKLTSDAAPKIVVLSAMSGTTNALVEICDALYNRNIGKAQELTNLLKQKYLKVISELYSTSQSLIKERATYHQPLLITSSLLQWTCSL